MNTLIRNELNKLAISFVEVDGKQLTPKEIPESTLVIDIPRERQIIESTLEKDVEYYFIFNSRAVKSKDAGVMPPVPLIFMNGFLIEETDLDMHLKLTGSLVSTGVCHHCLKFIESGPLCKSCKDSLGIISDEDIENIYKDAIIPKSMIKEFGILRR